MGRGYQKEFYTLSQRVRDPISRQQKADKIKQALIRHAHLPLASAVCLDIGCSSGVITSFIAPLFGKIFGLDYDEVALQTIDPLTRNSILFIRGDAMHLPFDDNTMDVIICAQVYEHVPDDERLFSEIYRTLKPGGMVFFSGPNWLFPIEPHYFLPFLHWLPASLANLYLRLTGRGNYYYERSRHMWGLRRLLHSFIIHDITLETLQHHYPAETGRLGWLVSNIPTWVWKLLLPLFPNFNWLLYKPTG